MRKDAFNLWDLVALALGSQLVRTVFLWGPPGTGKTFAGLNYGRIGAGVYCVTLTNETSAAELRGHFIFKGGDALWHDGPFVMAMKKGARLVVNEISHASADVLALLFPVLESQQTARLTLPSGETVVPAGGFHVVATDNHGPENLPEPLQDRFVATIHVTEPHPDALSGLEADLREVAESATVITDDRRVSARRWINLQMLSQEYGLHKACLLTFGLERGQMAFDAIRLALASRKKKKGN